MKVTRKVHGELMAARKAKRAAKQKNQEALDRFMAAVYEIRTTLDAIREAADEHFNLSPNEIHWGHVGDAMRTLEGPKEILAAIREDVK